MNKEIAVALSAEQTDIMNTIEAETTAFLNRDIEALCDCWVQEPYLQHTTILPYCGVVQVNGFDALRNHFLSHFNAEAPVDLQPPSICRNNWQCIVRGNMAWVIFEQRGSEGAAGHMSGLQMHTRILEKVSGSWKLVASTGVLSRLDFYDCPKIHVDGTAKVVQIGDKSRKAVAAHPALKISGGVLAASTQQDTSKLRSAIKKAQNDIDAGHARLPVPLVFGETSEPSSACCWIAILDMKIVVLMDDIRLIESTIETAGKIYGLSSMQMRVAEEIAKGKNLSAIAETLEVSTNTIRTHIKRMFERVGVNNQKALLKRLLSAQAPAVGLHY